MCLNPEFGHRRIWRGGLCAGTLTLTVAILAACATHRGEPPTCKGAFTPINPSSSVLSHGSQR